MWYQYIWTCHFTVHVCDFTVHVLVRVISPYMYMYIPVWFHRIFTCDFTVHVHVISPYIYMWFHRTCTCDFTVHVHVISPYMYMWFHRTCTCDFTVHVHVISPYMYDVFCLIVQCVHRTQSSKRLARVSCNLPRALRPLGTADLQVCHHVDGVVTVFGQVVLIKA